MFLALIRPEMRGLRAVARQYVYEENGADDLVQETLLRAWRAFSLTKGQTYERAWFYTILRNVARDWHRAAKRRVTLVRPPNGELDDTTAAGGSDALAPLPVMDEGRMREFLDDRIVAALNALEPSFREVVLLSVAGGLRYREIAQALDCPIGTVMSRMARARRALREQLSDYARVWGRVREGQT